MANKFKITIGLEIHIQLNTKSKMFCGCSNISEIPGRYEDKETMHIKRTEILEQPNTRVCPVCMGYPGVLPVANIEAIKKTIMCGLALSCEIAKESKFDRKHYFYPDLPKNFQISQYDLPFATNGKVELKAKSQNPKAIHINRVHLEEDAGKLVHPEGADYSLVDFNRCGTPLMEIVTEPDITSPLMAKEFLKKLRLIVRYLGVSDADMEKGQLRCDANISVQKSNKTSPIVEIKNMNSFRAVERALKCEEERLKDGFDEFKKLKGKQTRAWMENKAETVSMRRKEEASDYRYFPEPDIPPIKIGKKQDARNKIQTERQIEIDLEEIKKAIPELPAQKRERYQKFDLSEKAIESIVSRKKYSDYFDQLIKAGGDPHKVYDYMVNERAGTEIEVERMIELLDLIKGGKISNKIGKEMLIELKRTKKKPSEIIEEKGLEQVSDEKELKNIVSEVIKENPGPVKDIKSGQDKAIGFLVGQVMQKTKGKANPSLTNKIIKDMIK